MIKVQYQGQETMMDWEELRMILEQSTLPWFMDDSNIFVVGWGQDMQLGFKWIHSEVRV